MRVGIFYNRLLFKDNILLFSVLFYVDYCGGTIL